jgi:hypothetical protein
MFVLYRTFAAVQLEVGAVEVERRALKNKPTLWITFAKGKPTNSPKNNAGENGYLWNDKVVFAVGVNDALAMLDGIRKYQAGKSEGEVFKLVHFNNDGKGFKQLYLAPGTKGGMVFGIYAGEKGNKESNTSVFINIDDSEIELLRILCEKLITSVVDAYHESYRAYAKGA